MCMMWYFLTVTKRMNGGKGRKRILPQNWDLIATDGDNDSDDDDFKPLVEVRHNGENKSECGDNSDDDSDDYSDDGSEGDKFLFIWI